jgi:hypothetical protein
MKTLMWLCWFLCRFRPLEIKSLERTAQIAPTILQELGLNPQSLEAVVKEMTPLLPGLGASCQR